MTEERSQKKAFVVWDTQTTGLKNTLKILSRRPPAGWSVVPGGMRRRSGDLWEGIEQDMHGSDRVIGLVDLPNANVGFEIGFALAREHEVVLGWGGVELPEWVRQPPLDNFIVLEGGDDEAIGDLMHAAEGFRVGGRPEKGEDTLLLCPAAGVGKAYARMLREDKGWRTLPGDGWNLTNLSEQLDGVRRVVWIIAPYADGSDRRDGRDNAANGVIAGYWFGLRRSLHVWRDAEAREVVDPGRGDRVFGDVDDLLRLVEEVDRAQGAAEDEVDPLTVYLDYVAGHHRHLPSLFSGDGKDLPDVHVELALGSGKLADERHELLHAQRTLHGLLRLTANDHARVTRRWVVQGDPGAGKSTACRYLCHALADRSSTLAENWPGELPVPVFGLLADLAAENAPHPFSLAEREVRQRIGERQAEGVSDALHALANEPGAVWLFLDGLDELPQERRARVRENLLAWSEKLEHCVIVVASRTAGFTAIPGFLEARIQPLDTRRQKELIENWLGDDSEPAWRALVDRPTLRSLCTNPMLLSLVAYSQSALGTGAQLPTTRHGLYERAIEVLLKRGHGQEPKSVESDYACRKVLPYLALELMKEGGESWGRPELLQAIEGLADRYPDLHLFRTLEPWDKAIDRFLDDVGQNSGLIGAHEGEAQPWRWMHRSIGEYLAADGLNRLGPKAYKELAEQLGDAARWGEVFGYLCAFAKTADERLERLKGLAEVSSEIALRALPEVEGLEPSAAFAFLRGLSGWDGDDLLGLARGWRSEGRSTAEIDALFWDWLTPDRELTEVAYVVYALDGIEGVTTERVRGVIADREGTHEPPELEWKTCPPSAEFSLEFRMGSEEDEEGRYDDEGPAHPVTVAPFQLAETSVTEEQYGRFDPTQKAGEPHHPVVEVNWWEAWLFCRWLGGRLPTEAEWEYACRAGTTTRYWSGDGESDLEQVGWFDGNAEGRRHPVKEKPSNAFGLYDVHGNVWEWVEDRWSEGYSESMAAHPAAYVPTRGSYRVFRGGGFAVVAQRARSAFRRYAPPGFRSAGLGFRPARSHS
ncbi:MAG: SUMF1/EgtB/PvdO family nonheme iron enzyme [bacterium]|nr:SUMF1/EgtB/PvdO family nonheme iron enzyme [bacterium]